jgi:hypothetical protein
LVTILLLEHFVNMLLPGVIRQSEALDVADLVALGVVYPVETEAPGLLTLEELVTALDVELLILIVCEIECDATLPCTVAELVVEVLGWIPLLPPSSTTLRTDG